MKRLVSFLVVLSFFCSLQAQTIPEGILNYETVGRNHVKQVDITAFKTTFATPFHSASFDTLTNTALITLWDEEKKGMHSSKDDYNCTIIYYDIENQKIKWQRESNLQDGKYYKKGPYVFREYGKELSLIDEETGSEKYKIGKAVHPLAFDEEEGWIIYATERYFSRGTSDLKKVDLNTNKTIWRLELVSAQDLDIQVQLNDSVMLVVGDGLHAVNLKDGSGWKVKMVTEFADQVGNYVSYPMKVYSLPLIDSSFVYMAGYKDLVKLDHQGKEKWRTSLPSNKMSHSSLGRYKDYLVLINQGIAYASPYPYQSFMMVWGRPFFAAYDCNTGELVYWHERSKNADYILNGVVKKDVLYLIFADTEGHQSIEKYMISTGELVVKKVIVPIIVQSAGKLTGLVGSQVYTKKDSSFVRLNDIDTTGINTLCEEGVLCFDSDLKIVDYFSFNDLYVYQGSHGVFRFFSHEGKTVVVDVDDREVATLEFPKVFCTASEIYSIMDKNMYVINREQLLE